MPAYISHSIMALDTYKKLNNKNVSKDYMITFSLGGDLARFTKCRKRCHKEKTEEFIDIMWEYIKDNKLINSDKHMGVLYGHICHYYMDLVCHPLIRRVDSLCDKVSFKSHTLIECYIDAYLVKLKYNKEIDRLDDRYIFYGKMKDIYKMIDYVYEKVYGVKYVSWSYFVTKFLYSKVRYLILLFGKSLLIKVFSYSNFIKLNKNIDIINKNKDINYIDYLGKNCNDTFLILYEKSIKLSLNRINNLK